MCCILHICPSNKLRVYGVIYTASFTTILVVVDDMNSAGSEDDQGDGEPCSSRPPAAGRKRPASAMGSTDGTTSPAMPASHGAFT